MKKTAKIIIISALLVLILGAFLSVNATENDRIHKFTCVDGWNGKVYCNYHVNPFGEMAEHINPLPYGMINLGNIHSFTIYNGYIYYLTSDEGTDGLRGYIYRCNLDGTNNIYIADNATNYSTCYIVDDILYYTYGTDIGYDMYSVCGIARINLNTCEYKEIFYTPGVDIKFCDGNYIYAYNSYDNYYFRINSDGENWAGMSPNDIENAYDFFNGAEAYSAYGGAVYSYDWNRNSTWIANVPGKYSYMTLMRDSSYVENVVYDKIYYNVYSDTVYQNLYIVDLFMFSTDKHTNDSVFAASTFRS